ncbi:MAG: DUF2007 domain-containing protein [Lachnospiraceae bacterium]|jgi:plasmid replication initiation protein|nr:DUF2007 domain-containing protein [Lachnospiraceae bacterium]
MDKDKFIKITSTQSRAEAEQIVQILKENNIAAYSQGGVMNIYMGTSVTGEDIFVSEADQEAAKKLLEEFQPIKTSADFMKNPLTRRQKILNWIVLAVVIIILLCSIFIAFF